MDAPYEGAFGAPVLGWNLEILGAYAFALGGVGAWRAGPDGLLQGRFGWGNPASGLVRNTPVTPQDTLGIVIPLESVNAANGGVVGGPVALGGPQARWTWQTWDPAYAAWRLRAGLVSTLAAAGTFWLRFAGGAIYGDPVYASLVDGSAISGTQDDAVQTPWLVCSQAEPGCLALVSTATSF